MSHITFPFVFNMKVNFENLFRNSDPEEEDEIQLINVPGFCVRTLEEDKTAVEENLPDLSKNKKDAKKGGKKK